MVKRLFGQPECGADMAETPEWIATAARDAVAANKAGHNFAVSQAMIAVAARVERETIERCLIISRATSRRQFSIAEMDGADAVTTELSSLPRQYTEPKNG